MSKLILAEIVGVLFVVAGIALVSIPLSLVVLGVVIVAACEFRDDGPKGGGAT